MSKDKSTKKTVDLNKYEDPIDLSPKNLEFGLWLVTHRKLIYKIVIIILGSLAAISLLYSAYGYAYYFIFGRDQDKALQESNTGVDLVAYRQQNIPIDLKVGQAKAIGNNIGTDFTVKLKNSNEKQLAIFDFCFSKNGEKACSIGFILPSEEKNIVIINSPMKVGGGAASFELTNIAWQKIKAGEIPDWEAFKKQRADFIFTDQKLSNYGKDVNYLEFNITNNSSFGYFEIPLIITINQNGEVMAVNKYVVQGLNSQESKMIRFAWPEVINLNGEISIVPELNLLDNSIYKPYTSN